MGNWYEGDDTNDEQMCYNIPDMVGDVAAYHRQRGVPEGQPLTPPDYAVTLRRIGWIKEEVAELDKAAAQHDVVEFVDAVADIVYFALGALYDSGVTPDLFYRAWQEVHSSNMAKLAGPVTDGKQRKPDGWQPPDIAKALHITIS